MPAQPADKVPGAAALDPEEPNIRLHVDYDDCDLRDHRALAKADRKSPRPQRNKAPLLKEIGGSRAGELKPTQRVCGGDHVHAAIEGGSNLACHRAFDVKCALKKPGSRIQPKDARSAAFDDAVCPVRERQSRCGGEAWDDDSSIYRAVEKYGSDIGALCQAHPRERANGRPLTQFPELRRRFDAHWRSLS
jgi:hypothetical protein